MIEKRRIAAFVVATALFASCHQRKEEGAARASSPITAPDAGLRPIDLPPFQDLDASARQRMVPLELKLEGLLADRGTAKPDLAKTYGELGKTYHAFGLHGPAAACYENASRLEPAAFAWPYLLAHAEAELAHGDAALAALEKALALQPESLPALLLQADLHRAAGRFEPAKTAYGRALEVSPSSAPALYGVGQIAFLEGDFPRAIEHFEKALLAQPQAKRVHYPLALAYRRLGKLDQASRHFAQHGERDPTGVSDPLLEAITQLNPHSYARRGFEALRAGNLGQAMESLRTASDALPEDVEIRLHLGAALALSGRAAEALIEYRAALRLKPNDPRVHYNLGATLSALGRDEEAVAAMRRALELRSEYAEAQLGLARSLRRLGRDSEAVRSLEEAVRLDPTSIPARVARARLQARLGHCKEAVAAVEQDLETFPRDPPLTDLLARLLAACPDPAVRDAARAWRLADQAYKKEATPERAATLAFVQAARGAWDEAARWQRKAMALLPATSPPRARLALGEQLQSYERRSSPVEW